MTGRGDFVKEQIRMHVRLKDKLFTRVYLYFALIMVVFALVIGVVFIQLYRNTNLENYQQRMKQQAEGIAKQVQEYQTNGDLTGGLTYLAAISTIESLEIWVISNAEAEKPLNYRLANIDLSGISLAEEQMEVIDEAFLGESAYRSYYSEIHGYTILSVGVPVIVSQSVCGAVLINTEFASIDRGTASLRSTIIISALIALGVSFIISVAFVGKLTVPFTKMRNMALHLAEGDYEVSTGINRSDEIGDLARTLDFLTDKLKENEVERDNLEHMRMDFFANVSHELRTPITVVRAYTESLVDHIITDPDRVNQYYERMLSECKSMERLVGDLLTLSKMQNPDFVIEKEPVNLMQIFGELVRTAGKIAEEKKVSVKVNSNSDICMMYGDYDRLRQMFLVILDNAVKFSNENGTVTISVQQEEINESEYKPVEGCPSLRKNGKLTVAIRDNGIGIVPEEVPYVFDKFYKSKLRQNAKGSGLGLAIARQIAKKHEGTVEVASKVGEGTEFVFVFDSICEYEEN